MLRLAFEYDLLDTVAVALNHARDLRVEGRSVGKPAQTLDELRMERLVMLRNGFGVRARFIGLLPRRPRGFNLVEHIPADHVRRVLDSRCLQNPVQRGTV